MCHHMPWITLFAQKVRLQALALIKGTDHRKFTQHWTWWEEYSVDCSPNKVKGTLVLSGFLLLR